MFLHFFTWLISIAQQVQWLAPVFLVGSVAMPIVWLRRRREKPVGHTNVTLHKNLRSSSIFAKLATFLMLTVFVAFPMALSLPVLPYTIDHKRPLVREIILNLDKSGSMGGFDVPGSLSTLVPAGVEGCHYTAQQDTNSSGGANGQTNLRRIDAACSAMLVFVLSRPNDRIGLVIFDDQALWRLPLMLDNSLVADEVRELNKEVGGGTNFEGPTPSVQQMGPIQASINHLNKYGQSKSRIVIMVTDGEDSIHSDRMANLAQQLLDSNIHLYVLGVGDGWKGDKDVDLKKLADMVGGKVFRVADAGAMQAAFEEINRLEPSEIVVEQSVGYTQLYIYLVYYICLALTLYLIITVFITREKA